jgi:hypothetical protein
MAVNLRYFSNSVNLAFMTSTSGCEKPRTLDGREFCRHRDGPPRPPFQCSSHRLAHWQRSTAGVFSLLMDSASTSISTAARLQAAASALRVVASSFLSSTGSASIADPETCTVGGAGRSRTMKGTIMGYRAKTRPRLPTDRVHCHNDNFYLRAKAGFKNKYITVVQPSD